MLLLGAIEWEPMLVHLFVCVCMNGNEGAIWGVSTEAVHLFFFLNKILKSNHCFFNFNLRLQMIVNCHAGAEN